MSSSPGRPRPTVLFAVIAVAGVLAGCSGSNTNGVLNQHSGSAVNSPSLAAPSTPATATAPAGTGSAAAGGAPTKAELAAMLLTQADLPAGWTAAASGDSGTSAEDAKSQAAFAKCVGIRDTFPDQVAEADSPDFSSGNATISASASSFDSADDVTSDASAFQDTGKITRCMTKMLRPEVVKQLPPGAKIDTFNVDVVPGAQGGPRNVVGSVTATVTVSLSGQRIAAHITSYYVAGRQVESNVIFQNIGAPVPADLQAELVKVVADRVAGR